MLSLFQSLFKSSNDISFETLTQIFSQRNINLKDDHIDSLSQNLTGTTEIAKLLVSLCGQRNQSYKILFMKLWAKLDFYRRGVIKAEELINSYKADYHPHVNQNRGYKQKVDSQFLHAEFRRSVETFLRIKNYLVEDSYTQSSSNELTEIEFYEFCWTLKYEFDSQRDSEQFFYSVFKLK